MAEAPRFTRCMRIDHMHTRRAGCWELRPEEVRRKEKHDAESACTCTGSQDANPTCPSHGLPPPEPVLSEEESRRSTNALIAIFRKMLNYEVQEAADILETYCQEHHIRSIGGVIVP
jgi:hypothetical protein